MNKSAYIIGALVLAVCMSGCITGSDPTTYEGTLTDLTMDAELLPEGWYDHIDTATVDTCVPPIEEAITVDVSHAYNPGEGYITAHIFQNVTRVTEGGQQAFYDDFVAALESQFGDAWHEQHDGTVDLSPFAHDAIGDASFACVVSIDEIVDAEEDEHVQSVTYHLAFVKKDVVVTFMYEECPSLITIGDLASIAADVAARI
jgi:hypothetical protein